MKKRILSILLLCCMVLTLLPTAAFAADTGKAIQLGTDALSKNVKNFFEKFCVLGESFFDFLYLYK